MGNSNFIHLIFYIKAQKETIKRNTFFIVKGKKQEKYA